MVVCPGGGRRALPREGGRGAREEEGGVVGGGGGGVMGKKDAKTGHRQHESKRESDKKKKKISFASFFPRSLTPPLSLLLSPMNPIIYLIQKRGPPSLSRHASAKRESGKTLFEKKRGV